VDGRHKSLHLGPPEAGPAPAAARGRCRDWRVDEGFGADKVRSVAKVQAVFTFAILAYNLVRVPKLLEAT
jgi:hypothetical protein